jgi:mannose-6-phosphate isomerase-like protein (cupin superfamily)
VRNDETHAPEVKAVVSNYDANTFHMKYALEKNKKRRLRKGLKDQDANKSDDYDEDEELPEMGFEDDEDDSEGNKIIRIFAKSQRNMSKNFNVNLKGIVKVSNGQNQIIINNEIKKNMKQGELFIIPPLAQFSFKNYSNDEMLIGLRITEEDSREDRKPINKNKNKIIK